MADNPGLTTKTDTDKAILIKDGDWVWREPITMGHDATGGPAGAGILPRGLAIGVVTASGKAEDYVHGNSDGTETMVGILDQEVDVSAGDKPATYVKGFAVIDESECTGVDANGKTDVTGNGFVWA